jgi:hypothetical protein
LRSLLVVCRTPSRSALPPESACSACTPQDVARLSTEMPAHQWCRGIRTPGLRSTCRGSSGRHGRTAAWKSSGRRHSTDDSRLGAHQDTIDQRVRKQPHVDGPRARRAGDDETKHADALAEVDGNRTRLVGFTHDARFEGGGAHQVLGHLPGKGERTPPGREGPQTDKRSRAPVSLEGWRSLDIARASI